MKRVVFISSTGGHLAELLQLKGMFEKYDYHIITEKTKTNVLLKNKYKDRIHFLEYGNKHNLPVYMVVLPINIIKSVMLFLKIRPEVIVTTGAHTCVPLCYFAKIFGKKIIYIETFANKETKTLTGKIIYPIADLFIVQWEEMLKLYPKAVYGGWIY